MSTKYIVSSPDTRTVITKTMAIAMITAKAYLSMGKAVTITPIEDNKETVSFIARFIPPRERAVA